MNVDGNLWLALVEALVVALPAALFLLPLWWSGPALQFTIPVDEAYGAGEPARRLRRSYGGIVVATGVVSYAVAVAAIAAMARGERVQVWVWVFVAAPLLEVIGLTIAWATAWQRTLPHRVAHEVVRTASLQETTVGAGWWASTLSAWILPALAAWVLVVRWQQLPARFPVHWGVNGVANGWAQRTPAEVFWPLGTSVAMIAAISVMGWLIGRFSPAGATAPVRTVTLTILRAVCWLMGVVFATAALIPLMKNPGTTIGWAFGIEFAVFLCVLIGAVVRLMRTQRPDALARATSEENWKFGILYYNPADAALFVPKRLGYGYTFNFAHPVAWLMVVALLAVALIPLAVRIASHPH